MHWKVYGVENVVSKLADGLRTQFTIIRLRSQDQTHQSVTVSGPL